MNVRTMLTNGFDRNVGSVDRVIRALLVLSVPILYLIWADRGDRRHHSGGTGGANVAHQRDR